MRYTRIAGNSMADPYDGLSLEQIRSVAPSVFATGKHESRSTKYTYIPTSDLLCALFREGMVVTSVVQGTTRVEGRENFTKHQLTLRKETDLEKYTGRTRPEVLEIRLLNSHDGTKAYQLLVGLYRLVCSNGLVRWEEDEELHVPHRGDIVGQVVEGTLHIVGEGEAVMEEARQMKRLPLAREEQLLLARDAMNARFDLLDENGDVDPNKRALVPYQPADFLRVRRSADSGSDLWTTFNVIQENVIGGGVRRYTVDGLKKTRPIKGIDQNVKLNKALWRMAQEMATLKQEM